ncbi:portal protein [Stenotrophomonas phage Moby]|uniref:Portal protein n=1 Tax=Stenotrophomonas phage Moby TaxID=2601680 RepID=A0A5P8PM47_9CAUD|nr:portal protein [Stenotrophomonas phage Moby]QFR57754.1 portal protein [Stenotrophomonas phage Moby]
MRIPILGLEIKPIGKEPEVDSFNIDKEMTSEAVIVDHYGQGDTAIDGGFNVVPYQLAEVPAEKQELIRNYRELAASPEVDEALTEIRNEVFIFDVPDKKAIELDFTEESDLPQSIKNKILDAYEHVYGKVLSFDHRGIQYFDDWYVDGCIYLEKRVIKGKEKQGVHSVSEIDPTRIRKVRLLPKPDPITGEFDVNAIQEFYLYSNFDPKMFPMNQTIQVNYGSPLVGRRIHKDAITYVHSGLFDRNLGQYVSFLKKAIIPFNNLKMMEDAMVIFRVVRAPQRRAFYVDVSGMQKNKADAYMKGLSAQFKNKMVYDSTKGTLSNRRAIQTMLEDYWLPRRDGGKGTEVQTIDGQNAQDIMDEIEYLRDKLWRALGIPRSRFGDQPSTFVFGKGIEIQRDEYRFTKFLHLLRSRFILVIEDLLRTHLILTGVIKQSEWCDIREALDWQYTEDNAFVEFKESEIINNRLDSLARIQPYVGTYYSIDTVMRKILRMTDEEIKLEQEKMKTERPEILKRKKEEAEINGGDFNNNFG